MLRPAPMLCPACGASLDDEARRCSACGYQSDPARWTASPVEDEARGARVQSRVDLGLAGLAFAPAVALSVQGALGSTRLVLSFASAGLAFASSAFFAQRARDNLRAEPTRLLWSYTSEDGSVAVTSSIDPYTRAIRARGSRFDRAVYAFDPRWAQLRCDDETALALERWAMGDAAMDIEDARRWTLSVLALVRLAVAGAVDLVVQRSRVWSRLRLVDPIDPAPETTVIVLARAAGRAGDGDEYALDRAMLAALERVAPDPDPMPATTPEAVHYRSAQLRDGRVETPLATAPLMQLPLVAPSDGDDSPVYASIDGLLATARAAREEGAQRASPEELLAELEADRAVFRALHASFRAVIWDVGEYWDERT